MIAFWGRGWGAVLVAVLALQCAAGSWNVPLAGNMYRTEPAPGGGGARRDGAVSWSEPGEVHSAYFRVGGPATIHLALKARSTDGAARLEGRVGDMQFPVEIPSGDWGIVDLGTVPISAPGYVRVDFRGVEKTGRSYGELLELVVRTEREGLEVDFVRNNEGNMFYWGRRGPSVHLRYEVPEGRDITFAYSEITVPEGWDPVGSYYMANGFAEGYFGIQVNSPTERRVLFSVWSPFQTDNPRDIPEDQRVVVLGRGPGVRTGEFGNEGSGGQSYWVHPWKTGATYRFLTEVRPDGDDHTVYTAWFGDKAAGGWNLIASFRRPKTRTHLRGFHSFLESFQPAWGHVGRKARHGNVWVRDTQGEWHECVQARLSVDATGRGRHRLDYDGGVVGRDFFMRNCGFLEGEARPGQVFLRESTADQRPDIDLDALPR